MASIFNKLFKTTGIYTFSNIINAAIPFLLLPFLVHYLSPDDYAVIDLFQAVSQFTIAIVGLNTVSALSRFYFDCTKADFSKYNGNSFMLLLGTGVIVLIIFILFGANLETVLKIPKSWIWLTVVYAIGQNIIQAQLSIWQVKYQAFSYGLFRILRTLTDIILSVIFILFLKFNWEGRVLGQIIAVSAFAMIALVIVFKNHNIILKFEFKKVKELLSFGSPLIIHILGAVIITYSDRFFIANYIGLKTAGIYSTGYQIGMIVYLVQTSFNQAWVPWLYERLKINDFLEKIKIVKFIYLYFTAIILFSIIVALLAPYFYKLFIPNSYLKGIEVVIWIAIGFAFNGMYKMVGNFIFFVKKTYLMSIITICIAGINIVLNYIMVNKYGAIGVAQATAISFCLQFLITWVVSATVYKMPWTLSIKES